MTEQSNAIMAQRELAPQTWRMISEMAPVMYKSRLFGVNSPEAAVAIMLKGYELGLSITASFELVQVVQGKPALSPRGALALILNNPAIKDVTITRLIREDGSFLGYECSMERSNGFKHTERFTMEDAAKAELIKPGSGWAHYPENMCKWRVVGFCADVVAPDIVAGMTALMKMPEALNVELNEIGDVIDYPSPSCNENGTSWPSPKGGGESETPAEPTPSLDSLFAQYGAEEILVANEGKIPETQEEIIKVDAILKEKHGH